MRLGGAALLVAAIAGSLSSTAFATSTRTLDNELAQVPAAHGFTGRIESTFRDKLGRPIQCRRVGGESNEMFSDFKQHVIGVPQVAPSFGNVVFDGPGANEDFGLEQVTGDPNDRYMFRTAPLRNTAVMPAFMHNGAFVNLEDAIRHHLDPYTSGRNYSPRDLPPDLQGAVGPIEPVLARLDPLLRTPVHLLDEDFAALVDFVRNGLLDPRVAPERLKTLVPKRVPSGSPTLDFEFP